MTYNYKDSEQYRNYAKKEVLTVEELHEMILNMKFEERDLYDGSISTNKIQDFAVSGAKIDYAAIGTAHIEEASITTALIRDLSVSRAKIMNAAIGSAQIDHAVINEAHIEDAAIKRAHIQDAAIGNAQIEDASITMAKIKDLEVDTAVIKDLSVTTAKIADAAITNAKIMNAAITTAKIDDASITTAKIEQGAITTALIETGAIETAQIADGSITNAKIVDLTAAKITAGILDVERLRITGPDSILYEINVNSVGELQASEITLDGQGITQRSITTDKVVAGAITANEIAGQAITANKMATNSITAANAALANASVVTAKIADAAITNAKILNATITNGKIANATIQNAKIANATITAAKIANATITTAKIADAAITNAKIDNLDAGKIKTGILEAIDIKGVSITGSSISSTDPNNLQNRIDIMGANFEVFRQRLDFSHRISIDEYGVLQVYNATRLDQGVRISPYGSINVSDNIFLDGELRISGGIIGSPTAGYSYGEIRLRDPLGNRASIIRAGGYDKLDIIGDLSVEGEFASDSVDFKDSDVGSTVNNSLLIRAKRPLSSNSNYVRLEDTTGARLFNIGAPNANRNLHIYAADGADIVIRGVRTTIRNVADSAYADLLARDLEATRNIISGNNITVGQDIHLRNSLHRITVGSEGNFVMAGNRSSGYPFEVRSHANGSSYRTDLYINPADGVLVAPGSAARTSTAAANTRISSTGLIVTATSTEANKLAIEGLKGDPYRIMDAIPISWFDRDNTESYADRLTEGDADLWDIENIRRIPGFSAEQLESVGLYEFVDYDVEGNVVNAMYERLPILFIPIIKDILDALVEHGIMEERE